MRRIYAAYINYLYSLITFFSSLLLNCSDCSMSCRNRLPFELLFTVVVVDKLKESAMVKC